MSKNRFEGFSEGVFAFAFTLLAIGFVLPDLKNATNMALTQALVGLWPNLIAYVLSLMVVGIMWHNHQMLFRMVEKIDRRTIFWNILLLGGVAFIPFATSGLGTYPTLKASTFLYGLALTYCATIYNLLLNHLVRSAAFRDGVSEKYIAQTVTAYRTGWAAYIVAALFALWFPLLSFATYIGVTIYYLVPRGLDADLETGA